MNQRLLATVTRITSLVAAGLAVWTAPVLAVTPAGSTGTPALIDPAKPRSQIAAPVDALPPSAPVRLPDIDANEPQDSRISYAGGAVKFSAPHDWNVGELPSGRTIRLLLSPSEIPQSLADLRDGLWMTYRYRSAIQGSPNAELLQLLAAQTKRRVAQAPVVLAVDSKPAVYQEFVVPGLPGELRGLHLLARTREGLLTIHLVAPTAEFAQRKTVVLQMLQTMKLTSPDLTVANMGTEFSQAAQAVGSWKALQSRLVLTADGRVITIFDHKKHYAIDSRGYLDYKRKVKRLTGKFVARDDLILITWDDGSRLNYRWRVSDGQLFLTDHHGRVSQLERLFQ